MTPALLLSDAVLIASLSLAGTVVIGVLGIIQTILSQRGIAISRQALAVGEKNAAAIESVEKHTNSMKDALVNVTREAAESRGKVIGAADERNRMAVENAAHGAGMALGMAEERARALPLGLPAVAPSEPVAVVVENVGPIPVKVEKK